VRLTSPRQELHLPVPRSRKTSAVKFPDRLQAGTVIRTTRNNNVIRWFVSGYRPQWHAGAGGGRHCARLAEVAAYERFFWSSFYCKLTAKYASERISKLDLVCRKRAVLKQPPSVPEGFFKVCSIILFYSRQ